MKAVGTKRTVPIVPKAAVEWNEKDRPYRSNGKPPADCRGLFYAGQAQASSVSMESLARTVTFRS